MNILLISPLGFPIRPESRYTGIERLVYEYAKELVKEHDVTVMGHTDSIFFDSVKVLPHKPFSKDSVAEELRHFQEYQYTLRTFDVIHDFSHLHLSSRFMPNLPILSIFWHAPCVARYPKAPYNLIALSNWAAREWKRIEGYTAKYQQSIVIDTDIFVPLKERGDRFVTIGRMAPEKGNLNAILLCKELGLPLDVVGGRGAEAIFGSPETDYEKEIKKNCDGEQIRFLGEVTEDEKLKLMQSCKALIYCTNHPEVTSHKVQECMLCGAPVIVPALGAIPEIVTQGVDGFICNTKQDYITAIQGVDMLNPSATYEQIKEKYSVQNVVKNYVELYKEVANGLRW